MQTQRIGKRIGITFHRSVRRSVKIRAYPEASRPAERIIPLPQAEDASSNGERETRVHSNHPRIIRMKAPLQPDWEIVANHDSELVLNRGEAS
jgi:hypothetical protein